MYLWNKIQFKTKRNKSSVNILPVAEELAKFFPQLDDEDLNAVSVYTPMNTDALDVDPDGVFIFGGGSSRGDASACLTPVSFGMDISMIANKGSMTLSVDVSMKQSLPLLLLTFLDTRNQRLLYSILSQCTI